MDNSDDTITVATDHFKNKKNITSKRNVLKADSMLFDPLGLLVLFTIRLNLLMQQFWETGIFWDEPLQPEFDFIFQNWLEKVMDTQAIIIPQRYFKDLKFENLELYLFSDDNPKAYGTVAYFRKAYSAKISTTFVIAKSCIAPFKVNNFAQSQIVRCFDFSETIILFEEHLILKEGDVYLW